MQVCRSSSEPGRPTRCPRSTWPGLAPSRRRTSGSSRRSTPPLSGTSFRTHSASSLQVHLDLPSMRALYSGGQAPVGPGGVVADLGLGQKRSVALVAAVGRVGHVVGVTLCASGTSGERVAALQEGRGRRPGSPGTAWTS